MVSRLLSRAWDTRVVRCATFTQARLWSVWETKLFRLFLLHWSPTTSGCELPLPTSFSKLTAPEPMSSCRWLSMSLTPTIRRPSPMCTRYLAAWERGRTGSYQD